MKMAFELGLNVGQIQKKYRGPNVYVCLCLMHMQVRRDKDRTGNAP